jgi:hypothetical protein
MAQLSIRSSCVLLCALVLALCGRGHGARIGGQHTAPNPLPASASQLRALLQQQSEYPPAPVLPPPPWGNVSAFAPDYILYSCSFDVISNRCQPTNNVLLSNATLPLYNTSNMSYGGW